MAEKKKKSQETALKDAEQQLSREDVLRAYRNLLSLEDTFRTVKKDLLKTESPTPQQGLAQEMEGIDEFSERQKAQAWTPVVKSQEGLEYFAKMDLRKIGMGVSRRFWFILFSALLVAVGFSIFSQIFLRSYQAESVLLLKESAQLPGDRFGIVGRGFSRQTIIEMVRIPQNLQSVKAVLGLDLSMEEMGDMVNVVAHRRSNLVRVVATADNPSLAVDVANTLVKVSAANNKEGHRQQADTAFRYFSKEKTDADARLDEVNAEIAAFKLENQVIEMDLESRYVFEQLISRERDHQRAILDHQTLVVERANLRTVVGSMPDRVVGYEVDKNPLKARLGGKEMALMEARTRYGVENPKVLLLEEEIRQIQVLMEEQETQQRTDIVYRPNATKESLNLELMRMDGKVQAAEQRKDQLAGLLTEVSEKIEDIPSEQQEYAKLLGKRSIIKNDLAVLNESIRFSESIMEQGRSDLEIYQLAGGAAPRRSFATRYLPTIGFLFGGALALLFVLTAEITDKRIRTVREAQIVFDLPCIACIPEISRLKPRNAEAETLFYIRSLSEHLSHLPSGPAMSSVAFTSSQEQEGKSTIAYHMARYYQKLGTKTVYVDCDRAANSFTKGTSFPQTINWYLEGNGDESSLLATQDDLAMMKMGHQDNVEELMKSERWTKLWTWLQNEYDMVVLDAPGIIENDYGISLMELADASVFVIASPSAKRSLVKSSLEELDRRHIRPTGLVMNRMEKKYIETNGF